MSRKTRTGPLVLLLCIAIVAGSCAPMRSCCRSSRADLLATGLVGWQQIGAERGLWQFDGGTITGRAASGESWLATVDQYSDFELSLELRISPGAEGGVYLRTPLRGDPTFAGMEIQILDDATLDWGALRPTQVMGSIYDVQAPSERMGGPAGQWQEMVVRCRGSRLRVVLNGKQVIGTDVTYYPYLYDRHPGLTRCRGYIGLHVGAGTIEFRNIHIEPFE